MNMKKFAILVLIVAVIGVGLYIAFPKDLDRFNPLYKEEYVYAVINKPGEPEGPAALIRSRYNLTGYTAQGKEKKITFSSGKNQEQGLYVKILAKGAYTKEWSFVKKEDVPPKALR